MLKNYTKLPHWSNADKSHSSPAAAAPFELKAGTVDTHCPGEVRVSQYKADRHIPRCSLLGWPFNSFHNGSE